MLDDDQKHKDQFDAALPLPIDDSQKTKKQEDSINPAADLIRKKVEAAFANEPSAREESEDIEESGEQKLSKHQKFIMELTSSAKPLHEIQIAWHEYYAALPDKEKHEVWQEFYRTHAEASHYQAATKPQAKKDQPFIPKQLTKPASGLNRGIQNFRGSIKQPREPRRARHNSPLRSLVFGLSIGLVVLVVFLFSFFNERFIAPFIQPSRSTSNIPLISSSLPVSSSPQLIIPKINVQIPIVYASDDNENTIETDLENGVVHYADTAMPGQDGNLVIFGHSSNNIFNPGHYKFAFVLLKRLDNGDTFYIDNNGKRYTYEVFNKTIVSPSNVDVLGPIAGKTATATLITCDPPGTSINRLIVNATQIDPNPTENTAASANNKAASEVKALASNGPTLWQRFIHWLW